MLPWLHRHVRIAGFNASATPVSKPAIALLWVVVVMWCALGPAKALPVFAQQYRVPCSMCHSIPPRLNTFGYAFQANHFNMPGNLSGKDSHPTQKSGTYVPITTIATSSYSNSITSRQATINFRSIEFFFAGGLGIGPGRQGGYFIDLTAGGTGDAKTGDLDDAYFTMPLLGRHGQLAMTVGQVTPLLYQYDPVNSLTDTLPFGISEGVDNFAFGGSKPMVRLDYFDNRGKASPDGNYLSVAVPFRGHLELTRDATVGSGSGVFAHAFHRWGYTTVGALGYVHKDSSLVGLIGTHAPCKRLYLTGIATLGHEPGLSASHLAMEAEYLPNERVSLTGRAELVSGDRSELATVAAINYYPFPIRFLRLSAESHQRRAERGFDLKVRLQY